MITYLRLSTIFVLQLLNMHTAYSLGSLLKLPHAIQSMAAFGDFLLVGTKQGHLLMYLVKFNDPLPGLVPGKVKYINRWLNRATFIGSI